MIILSFYFKLLKIARFLEINDVEDNLPVKLIEEPNVLSVIESKKEENQIMSSLEKKINYRKTNNNPLNIRKLSEDKKKRKTIFKGFFCFYLNYKEF